MTNIITEKLESLYLTESSIEIINEYYNRDIQKLDELINEGFVQNNIDKLTNSYNKNINTVKKVLIDHGINVNRIKSKGILLSKTFKNDIRNREKPEVIQSKIIKGVAKIVREEAISVKKEFDALELSEKIISSIFIFLIVLLLNTFLSLVGAILFSPQIASILLALVIAPIIEESAKRLAIVQKYPWIYTGIFAGLELLQYVTSLISAGGMIVPILIIRLLALLMHFSTTFVQKYFREKETEKTEDEEGLEFKNKMDKIGYFLAIAIHVLWNTVSLIMNKKLEAFIGL